MPEPTSTDTEQSLAAAARNSRKQAASKAKKVFTEDNLDAPRNALPALTMDDADNSDDILAAIGEYKQTHTPEQTEEVVHAWYEKYDEELAAAIQQNKVVMILREENASNGYELCRESGDYQSCEAPSPERLHWDAPRPGHHYRQYHARNPHSARVHENPERLATLQP
jgi:hypothetical protein